MQDQAIVFKGISKKFGDTYALRDVTLELPSGHIVGLIGPNGAGKSTLLRLISGVMRPSTGFGRIYGHDLIEERNEVKKITGLLPEETALYEKLSVQEYIEFIGALYEVNPITIERKLRFLSKELGMEKFQGRLIETLSKGQKQKIALIASLIHDPKVLLLDEPMANLDVVAQIKVKEIIKQYKQEEKVIIIATHLLENVFELCDTISIISEGRILFTGTVSEFLGTEESMEKAYLSFFLEERN